MPLDMILANMPASRPPAAQTAGRSSFAACREVRLASKGPNERPEHGHQNGPDHRWGTNSPTTPATSEPMAAPHMPGFPPLPSWWRQYQAHARPLLRPPRPQCRHQPPQRDGLPPATYVPAHQSKTSQLPGSPRAANGTTSSRSKKVTSSHKAFPTAAPDGNKSISQSITSALQ